MSVERFDVGFSEELPGQIIGTGVDVRLSLLDTEGLHGPVHGVKTGMEFDVPRRKSLNLLVWSTVTLNRDFATDAVVQDLQGYFESLGYAPSVPYASFAPRLRGMYLREQQLTKLPTPLTHISQRLGTNIWGIETSLMRKGHSPEHRLWLAEDSLRHHAEILSGFLGVIFERENRLSEVSPTTRNKLFFALQSKAPESVQSEFTADALSEFVGIDAVIDELRDFILLANSPLEELDQEGVTPEQVVLLHGPSGVGKSAIAKALARELGDEEPKEVRLSEVQGNFVGEWAAKLDKLFEAAYASPERQVIIMDEFDGLIKHGGTPDGNNNIVAVMKQQLERITEHPHVFLVLTSNKPEVVDPVLLVDKRVPLKIGIPLPDDETREALWRRVLVDEPLTKATIDSPHTVIDLIDRYQFTELVRATDGMSGGDIRIVVNKLNRERLLAKKKGAPTVTSPTATHPTQEDILKMVSKMRKRQI